MNQRWNVSVSISIKKIERLILKRLYCVTGERSES